MWVILIGNPAEGFTITGVFGTHEDAEFYGDQHIDRSIEWWVFEVNPAQWKANQTVPATEAPPETTVVTDLNMHDMEHYIRTGEKH